MKEGKGNSIRYCLIECGSLQESTNLSLQCTRRGFGGAQQAAGFSRRLFDGPQSHIDWGLGLRCLTHHFLRHSCIYYQKKLVSVFLDQPLRIKPSLYGYDSFLIDLTPIPFFAFGRMPRKDYVTDSFHILY